MDVVILDIKTIGDFQIELQIIYQTPILNKIENDLPQSTLCL